MAISSFTLALACLYFVVISEAAPQCNSAEDFIFGTGGSVINHTRSSTECCNSCADNYVPHTSDKCESYVWHPDTGECWLHPDYKAVSERDGVVSGVLNHALPPLPPSPPPIGPMGGWSGIYTVSNHEIPLYNYIILMR